MPSKLTVAMALGVFVMLIAFTFPPIIDATQNGAEQRLTMQEGETGRITEGLEAQAVSTGQNEANISVISTESGSGEEHLIQEGETVEFNVSDDSINVTLEDSTASYATINAAYPRTYGWTPAGTMFIRSMPIILLSVALMIVAALIVGVRG